MRGSALRGGPGWRRQNFGYLASKDGVDGVGIKLFKARANLPQREIYMFFSILQQSPKSFPAVNPHAKLAIRLFLEWRFAYLLCGAQEMSKCPKNEFRHPR
jgi:hypothetical protein